MNSPSPLSHHRSKENKNSSKITLTAPKHDTESAAICKDPSGTSRPITVVVISDQNVRSLTKLATRVRHRGGVSGRALSKRLFAIVPGKMHSRNRLIHELIRNVTKPRKAKMLEYKSPSSPNQIGLAQKNPLRSQNRRPRILFVSKYGGKCRVSVMSKKSPFKNIRFLRAIQAIEVLVRCVDRADFSHIYKQGKLYFLFQNAHAPLLS